MAGADGDRWSGRVSVFDRMVGVVSGESTNTTRDWVFVSGLPSLMAENRTGTQCRHRLPHIVSLTPQELRWFRPVGTWAGFFGWGIPRSCSETGGRIQQPGLFKCLWAENSGCGWRAAGGRYVRPEGCSCQWGFVEKMHALESSSLEYRRDVTGRSRDSTFRPPQDQDGR